MHRLSTSFVLGYHGCNESVGESLLAGEPFRPSDNDYDWLGPGTYFWESNPQRGLEFATESFARKGSGGDRPFVIGAVLELGLCLDMTTSIGMEQVRAAHGMLVAFTRDFGFSLPENSPDYLLRYLDCAVIRYLHDVREGRGLAPVDTIKGVFTEGSPLYEGSGFRTKTHVQIAVRNPQCIKGVFRVPLHQLEA